MEGLFQAKVEWNKELNVSFDDVEDDIFEAKIIVSEEIPPQSTFVNDLLEAMHKTNAWDMDKSAYEFSFQMRHRWGKNVKKPLTGRDINELENQGWCKVGYGEAVIVKKDETSKRNYLRHHLLTEDEYYLGCWNGNIYNAISPSLTVLLENESYEALGLLIKEKFFEEFMNYIFENFAYKDCIRHECSFEFDGHDFFLIDIDDFEEIK